MRLSPLVATALLGALLAGCTSQHQAGPGGHPRLIVVRQFAFSPGVITLDPSLGFSLYRGSPGASPRARADTVGRAAAFSLADTIAEQLRTLGYDAIRSDEATAEPGGRALIVTGAFRRIVEGHRRQNASVAAEVDVASQTGAAAPQRLAGFDLDSRTVPRQSVTAGSGRRAGVNLAAERLATTIARYVADLARLNRWPTAR